MKTKITVIGAGNVGSTIAFMMSVQHTADEVVIVDINQEKALGEAMDIRQGTPLTAQPVSVYAGTYESAAGSDIVIITSGIPRKPGQTRMDLAQTNVNVIKDIAPQITKYCPDATYIIVSNPVDILTYVFHKVSNIPHERIIGSGTLLDTARLRARLAEYLNVSEKNVHAYVFGEHGETSFIPWSIAQVSTINLLEYKDLIKLRTGILTDLDFDEIENYMRASGAKIIKRKGATYYYHRHVGVRHLRLPVRLRQRRGHRLFDAQRRVWHRRRLPEPAHPHRRRRDPRPHPPAPDRRRDGEAARQRQRPQERHQHAHHLKRTARDRRSPLAPPVFPRFSDQHNFDPTEGARAWNTASNATRWAR